MKLDHIGVTSSLHNGVKMPRLGLGVWQAKDGKEVEQAVRWAIEEGYRSIDTATIYRNEEGVGKAIKESGVDRESLFVTSKVWNGDQGFESALRAFETSLKKLDTEYLDLYLIHWPVKGKYKETWKALEKLYSEEKVKAIGVSNFMVHHLEDLLKDVDIKPMVNQVEFHPELQQPKLLEFCHWNNIQHEAWSPLMQGKVTEVSALTEIGNRHGKSPAQVALRWALQKGSVVIPKSVKQHRIQENARLFDFQLSEEEMEVIDGLDKGKRIGPDPDNFNF